MPKIEIKTVIDADIKTCFDLARDIDFHQESLKHSKEKAIAGKTSGLISLNEWVTWEAIHFGLRQQLTSKITVLDSPHYFVDEMVKGAFKSFTHEHIFQSEGYKTLMIDKFHFVSPYGFLGRIANVLFLKRYMKKLLTSRSIALKNHAEFLT